MSNRRPYFRVEDAIVGSRGTGLVQELEKALLNCDTEDQLAWRTLILKQHRRIERLDGCDVADSWLEWVIEGFRNLEGDE